MNKESFLLQPDRYITDERTRIIMIIGNSFTLFIYVCHVCKSLRKESKMVDIQVLCKRKRNFCRIECKALRPLTVLRRNTCGWSPPVNNLIWFRISSAPPKCACLLSPSVLLEEPKSISLDNRRMKRYSSSIIYQNRIIYLIAVNYERRLR